MSTQLHTLTTEDVGKTYTTQAEIVAIVQTKGPTIFKITDGNGTLSVKSFKAPGVRAQPDLNSGDYVEITYDVTEFRGNIEAEGKTFKKVDNPQAVQEAIAAARKEHASIGEFSFLIESPITDKLKERFGQAAGFIKAAIADDRPILIRHHNDADGYSSGVALERAILPLIEKRHGPMEALKLYTRSACRAPFYEYEDSLRDVMMSANAQARFNNKPPLVLIVDNGSTAQDLTAIKQGKIFGMEFIVVDHHPFGDEDVISAETLVHINPYLVDETYEFTAGMLCVELAHILNPTIENGKFIAAMAGIADHTESPELEKFIALADKDGYNKEQLTNMGIVIDYISRMLRNNEARELNQILFGKDKQKQMALVDLLLPQVLAKYDRNVQLAKTFGVQEQHGGILLQLLDIERTFSRDTYPPAGKTTGLYHDSAKEQNERVVTIGHFGDGFTLRATEAAGVSVHEIIERIHQQVPEAFAEGGGHDVAGSVRYVPATAEKVFAILRQYFDEIGNK